MASGRKKKKVGGRNDRYVEPGWAWGRRSREEEGGGEEVPHALGGHVLGMGVVKERWRRWRAL